MKEYKKYYEDIIKTPAFAHINKEEDLEWLMTCLEGTVVDYKGGEDLWYENGYLFVNIYGTEKALRMKRKRAEKLCNFKCEFHKVFIDYLLNHTGS